MNLEQITSSSGTVKNESDVTKGSYYFTMNSGSLITQQEVKNVSRTTKTQKGEVVQGSEVSSFSHPGFFKWKHRVHVFKGLNDKTSNDKP